VLSLKRKEERKSKREGSGKIVVFHFRLILQLAGTEENFLRIGNMM